MASAAQAPNEYEKPPAPPAYQLAPPTNPAPPTNNPPQYQPDQPSTAQYAGQPITHQQAWPAPQAPTPHPIYNAQYIVQQPGTYVYQTQPQALQTAGHHQQNVTVIQASTAPQDYFSFGLFVMLCCCLPFGIVAIVKSGEVKNRAAVGDMTGAQRASTSAKRFAWIGCSIGIILWVIGIICMSIWIAYLVEDCMDGYC